MDYIMPLICMTIMMGTMAMQDVQERKIRHFFRLYGTAILLFTMVVWQLNWILFLVALAFVYFMTTQKLMMAGDTIPVMAVAVLPQMFYAVLLGVPLIFIAAKWMKKDFQMVPFGLYMFLAWCGTAVIKVIEWKTLIG